MWGGIGSILFRFMLGVVPHMMACDLLLMRASGRRFARTLRLVLVSFRRMLALCGRRSCWRQLTKKMAAV